MPTGEGRERIATTTAGRPPAAGQPAEQVSRARAHARSLTAGRPGSGDAWRASGVYLLLTIVATWPLTPGLGRDVAWDLGDPLLNMWILSWVSEQLLSMLRGDFSQLGSFFDGNIFHPAPLTLAYSEHLLPQAIQTLPIYAATRNPILVYNLLFLSTFVLSGLGAYLFVRELTGRRSAAFVAGLLFAFAPYRFPQGAHLHVLSAQWMPFALYGFRCYITAVREGRGRGLPLAGAAAALVLQNLSCGYYLLYFAPFAGAYVLWEIAARDLWRRGRMWLQLGAAAVAVLALTVPMLLPYLAVAEEFNFTRSRTEVIRYSADVHSYATAFAGQPVWGERMRAFPKPEGDLFFGAIPMLLALAGLLFWRAAGPAATAARSAPAAPGDDAPVGGASNETVLGTRGRRALAILLGASCVVHTIAAIAGLAYRRIVVDLWLFDLQISNINQMLIRAAVSGGLLLMVSSSARRRAMAFARGPGFFVVALVAAMWLSLGPAPQVQGRPVEIFSPYAVLYDVVPGFEGVRVPARFAMVAVLMLSVLGGLGAAWIATWARGAVTLGVLSILFLAETIALPFTLNGFTQPPGYNAPEGRIYRPQRAPNVYRQFANLAPEGILAELPLGEPDFDLRSIYYSTVHWRPVLNGYSGYFPPHYGRLALALSDVPRFPEAALEAFKSYGATHVIVHEGAYLDDRGVRTTATLLERGARELYREGGDVLLQLP